MIDEFPVDGQETPQHVTADGGREAGTHFQGTSGHDLTSACRYWTLDAVTIFYYVFRHVAVTILAAPPRKARRGIMVVILANIWYNPSV
jgi:hypothetical protein